MSEPPAGNFPPPGGYPAPGGYYAPIPGAPGALPKEAYTPWITRTAAVIFGLAAVAFAVWNLGYRQGTTGSSIGKSALKFKVVGEQTGQPIGFGKSILRQFAHIADAIICNIGYLFPLWDAKRQTIADKIMSTICLPI